ncbi:uncharacterized protein PGTG_03077 [Puccinia graminis f. sp. tritici CRL 75-36-700-3]|uniref:Nucleoporin NSP1 n=1 Tax=Puccinia graminis f. sp. tritici (strain CRL 75-36-700-3 / race SCCL) TaxID=418459 RepID=E3JYJ6_PUCGT|nr:uncharacterized protein PGTG_03077 [Puccinia graminis f. sp. tritici CRL 75-36-700-3]EFP77121.2 hypothetical protein PGTG_03077 [Puccinia graminis f. sp. tritici CRL 75-36-700-3]
MGDANKSNPAPLFGGSSSTSLFGSQAGKPATFGFGGTSPFGASQAATSTTPQTSPTKSSTPSFNFISAPGSNNPGGASGTNAPTSSLFGGGNTIGAASSAPKSIFGNPNPATGTTSSAAPSIFGGNSTSNTSNIFGGNSSSNTSNIFGGNSSNPTPATSTSNSNQSTATPAPASKPSLFGNTTGTSMTSSNLFGTPAANSGSAPASTTTSTTFAFGGPPANQPPKDANKSESLFGGLQTPKPAPSTSPSLFGAKPADSSTSNNPQASVNNNAPAAGSATPATTAAASPSLFAPIAPKPSSTSDLPAKPSTPSPFGNMNNSALTIKSTAPVKSSPLAMNSSTTGEGSQANKSATPKPAGTPPATPSTKPNMNLAPSLLKGKTLEDLVARWNSELDERVEDFKHTANEIAAWDQVLIQNGDQISMLYDELQQIEPMQQSIDQTLDYVETQQQELSVALDDYERQLSGSQAQDFSASSTGRTRTAAQEREEAYKTAEEVHVQLNDMASSLGTMIAELNSLAGPGNRIDESSLADGTISSGSSSNEDPIVQIAGILNAHLGSLNWIGEITQELGVKVNELESRVSNTKVEFGLEPSLNHYRQIEFNSDEFNPNLSATVGPSGTSLNSGFGNRIPSGLLSHPRR